MCVMDDLLCNKKNIASITTFLELVLSVWHSVHKAVVASVDLLWQEHLDRIWTASYIKKHKYTA